MRSMTGFGRCIMENSQLSQQWEIRSVNGKRLDLKWVLPAGLRSLESRFEKTLRQYASRGRVDITLTVQYATGSAECHFDAAQASAMLDALEELARVRGDAFEPDYASLLQVPALWGATGEDVDEGVAEALVKGLEIALEDWNEAREAEGAELVRDLASRVARMQEWLDEIREQTPQIRAERIENLRTRFNEQLEALACGEIEEARFLQEVTILTDRLDVTEEITRLSTHLDRLTELLDEGADAGRRLDFTLQECFREINTCGNKIPDVQLSRIVVDFKNELEKCREQVQNLE